MSDEPSVCYAISAETLVYKRIACKYMVRWTHYLRTNIAVIKWGRNL